MQGRFKFEHLSKYPHLLEEDVKLWDAFISQYPNVFDRCDYDIHVGKGVRLNGEVPANIVRMATHLSQCRIDVVGFKGKTTTIVEVKPRARSNAIGQIITYKALYEWQYPDQPKPRLMIVTDDVNSDTLYVAEKNHINIKLVDI